MSQTSELERIAARYAQEATQQDRQGRSDQAIMNYKRTIDVLVSLRNLSAGDLRSTVYEEKINTYTARIEHLTTAHSAKKVVLTTDDRPSSCVRTPEITLSEVAISDDALKAIQESIILRIRRPELFKLGGVRGILLHGPPGCGKTLLSAAIANETKANFLPIDAASIMSKWLGESEKNLAGIFQEAKSIATDECPSIIFIDEVDALAGVNTFEVGGEVRTRMQLLNEMDSARDKKQRTNVYVIAATNKPWSIDEPFLRRFQKRIYLDLPDRSARLKLIHIFSTDVNISPDVNREELAMAMKGYSGSDIRDIFEAVEAKIAREIIENQNLSQATLTKRPAKKDDFEEVIRNRKPSVSESNLSYYKKWTESFGAL